MSESVHRLSSALADRYRIERELGQGGMATVYLAHDLRHDRKVAIKLLHPELAAVLGVERFLTEIRTTAGLQHPGILPLFDSGEAVGQVYYVMPFVEGESLRARLQREGQLPLGDAVRIAAEVAEALAYAHDHGVVHRDIKPENILLQSNRPVVADFGIALAVQKAGGARLTQTGLSLGTPQYMSPEQAAAERTLDGRTDIYALGCVLYEMLAGEPPFTAPTTQALIAKLLSEEPRRLESLRKSVPPSLADVVHTALEKLPADRFASGTEFAQALRGGSTGATASTRTPARGVVGRPRQGFLASAGLALAGALVGGLAILVTRPRDPVALQPPIRFEIPNDTTHPIRLVCCGRMLALSPDGRTVVFQSGEVEDSAWGLYARDLDSPEPRPIVGTQLSPRGLFFSPDGKRIGFESRRALLSVPAVGGTAQRVTEIPTGFFGGGTWTDDDRIVFASAKLYVVPATGGQPETLAGADTSKGEREYTAPHFVSGANAVLFTVTFEGRPPEVRILWLDSGRMKSVTGGAAPSYVASGGWLLLVRPDSRLMAYPFDPATGDTLGAAVQVADGVALRSPVGAFAEYAASPTGVIVRPTPARAMGGSEVQVLDARGVRERIPLSIRAHHFDAPRLSPDGRRLAVIAADMNTRTHSVYVVDLASRALTLLGSSEGEPIVEWTSRGDSVLSLEAEGRLRAYPVDRSSAGATEATLRGWRGISTAGVRDPWIAVGGTGPGGGSLDIGIVRRDSLPAVRPYLEGPFHEASPAISPDARWLAYESSETGETRQIQVYLSSFPVPGERFAVSVDGGTEPRWSRDGQVLYYRNRGQLIEAALARGPSFAIAGRRPAFDLGARIGPGDWDIDPARRRVYFVESAPSGNRPLLVELNALPLRARARR